MCHCVCFDSGGDNGEYGESGWGFRCGVGGRGFGGGGENRKGSLVGVE